jgi:hypothetical protein
LTAAILSLCPLAIHASEANGNDPHLEQLCPVNDSTVTLRVSGVLQPGDSQFVHDLYCKGSNSKIGTVRMRWGHKYGARYGGVGTVVEGDIQDIWKGDNGWTTVRLTGNFDCTEILVKPRIAKIPD